MSLKDVKKQLTDSDIIKLLAHLGSSNRINNNNANELIFETICHHSKNEPKKYKLYYYKNTQRFHCYSHCSNIGDIFALVEQVLNIEKKEAVKYVLKFFNIDTSINIIEEEDYGFDEDLNTDDDNIVYQSIKLEDVVVEPLKPIKRQGIMRGFLKYYPSDWLKEGISKETMDKYEIRYSVDKNAIVIPHHNIEGEIIGVRVRNFDSYAINTFGKYTPMFHNNKLYNHKLGHNLYGLDKNKETIKKFKKAIVFEGEKSVLIMNTIYGENSVAVGVSGSSFSRYQMKMLIDLGVEEVIIAFDKQYSTSEEEEKWSKKIERIVKPLLEYGIKVSKIWDSLENGLLEHKMSPIDKGKEVYDKLVRNRQEIILKEEIRDDKI